MTDSPPLSAPMTTLERVKALKDGYGGHLCKCNIGDHIKHTHYQEPPYSCARCGHLNCPAYDPQIPDVPKAPALPSPVSGEDPWASLKPHLATLLGPKQPIQELVKVYRADEVDTARSASDRRIAELEAKVAELNGYLDREGL